MSIRRKLWRIIKTEIKHNLIYIIKKANSYGNSKSKRQARAKSTYNYSYKQPTKIPTKIEKYYSALELKQNADHKAVKAAYIKLVKKYHPDKFQDEEKKQTATELLQKINEAYAGLNEYLQAS